MKLQIIGGGISGLLTALMARVNHHEVTVYEASPNLGGILRDYLVDDDWYFHNTQYINEGSLCHNLLKNYTKIDLIEFSHEYGSITQQLDRTEIFHEDFAQPVFKNQPPSIVQSQKLPSTIDEWLNLYGENYPFLHAFAKRFGDIDELHLNSIIPMQISRVFYPRYTDELLVEKQTKQVADMIFGLPRSILTPNVPKQKALLPVLGYNDLVANIECCLKDMGVKILTSQPITPKSADNGSVELYARGKRIIADKTIWCGNPTSLIFQTMKYKLSNRALKTYCAIGKCDYIPNLEPIYIQVFSLDSSVVRFFLYNHGNSTKITVEGVGHIYNQSQIKSHVDNWLLKYFSINLRGDLTFINEKRYVLLTYNDFKNIQNYMTSSYQSDIIAGGWECYGRDAKLDVLNKAIQEL